MKLDMTKEFVQQVATKQWQADILSGTATTAQQEKTDKALESIGLTRESWIYKRAYQRAQDSVS